MFKAVILPMAYVAATVSHPEIAWIDNKSGAIVLYFL